MGIFLFVVVAVVLTAIVVRSVTLYGDGWDPEQQARALVELHRIRRQRELAELRQVMRRDAQQLRRALDRDFGAVENDGDGGESG
jgi:hypothetical protein